MTVCNMSIEGGARAGLIAPDETTFDYLKGRPMAPKGAEWEHGRRLLEDAAVRPGRQVRHARSRSMPPTIVPQVTWGTSPQDVVPITGAVPDPADGRRRGQAPRHGARAGLHGPRRRHADDGRSRSTSVFIGSCTNGRIEDLRAAAAIAKGRKVAAHVGAMVVPGSGLVKEQAEKEGLDRVFIEAGFEWREPGCSMCLAMNAGQARAGRALRLDLEPQLRGPPGPRRAHPPGEPGHGRGRRHRRPARRRARARLSRRRRPWKSSPR